jgi:hypothetical protein
MEDHLLELDSNKETDRNNAAATAGNAFFEPRKIARVRRTGDSTHGATIRFDSWDYNMTDCLSVISTHTVDSLCMHLVTYPCEAPYQSGSCMMSLPRYATNYVIPSTLQKVVDGMDSNIDKLPHQSATGSLSLERSL